MPRPNVIFQSMSSLQPTRPGNKSLRKGRLSLAGQIYHVTARAQLNSKPFAHVESAYAACATFHATSRIIDVTLLAWVLMPDHAHWLIEMGEQTNISTVIARLKSSAAGAINQVTNAPKGARVWQAGFYERAIRSDEDVLIVARYVIANPLRAGLVARLGDYPWWNSVWL